MNIEVEVKVRVDNFKKIKSELKKYGKLIRSIKQIDEYYTPCHRDFFEKKPIVTEWLRIRTNPDKVLFEYDKTIIKNTKEKEWYGEEYKTEISQPIEFRKVLKFLDFKKLVTVEKKRELWDCGNFEVCLDEIKDLGFFIEVEIKKSSKDILKEKKMCYTFLNKLGVEVIPENIPSVGYPLLLLGYK